MVSVYVGYVASIEDKHHGDRIKAVIKSDVGKDLSKVPYAFPLLPKILHVKPKLFEAVLVIVANDKDPNSQRWFLGPIISQPDKMYNDSFAGMKATDLLGGALAPPSTSVDNYSGTTGSLPQDEDVAILGRKDTDIILTDDDVRIRAGVRLTDGFEHTVKFNRDAPAYVKLKHHEVPLVNSSLTETEHNETRSTATIVADKINLISQNGDGGFNPNEPSEGITDDKMKDIIARAHRLPYGDLLCEFFSEFLTMYRAHSHPSNGAPPLVADPESTAFWSKYSTDKEALEKKLLSKDIRIN